MLNRFDTLITLMGYDTTDNGVRTEFIEKLKFDSDVFAIMKILVGCYIAGRKILKKRLAIDVWKKFKNFLNQKYLTSIENAVIDTNSTIPNSNNIECD